MKINKFFAIFLFCLFGFDGYCAELNISVDKPIVTEGDTLYLTIDYNGESTSQPDLSPLRKDFHIVSNSSSQYVNIVNGNFSQTKKWTVGLKPLKKGKIFISPIKIDDLISNDVEIEVREMTNVAYIPDSKNNSNSPYFQIEQSLDNRAPYVQQQVILFVTVYDSIGLQDGSINVNDESQKDWIIVPLLDKPIVKQDVVNRKQMNVITFAFAAFPQRSGVLKTPEISFDGFYLKNTDFNFPDFNDSFMTFGVDFKNVFGQKVPVKMKTNIETINVKPAPALPAGSSWLPLSDLKLEAHWASKTKFTEGEALSRTITITATGMTESMLPQISFSSAKGFKQYPEKPVVKEQVVQGKLVTTATINNVYIPTESGELIIPEFQVAWFNVDANRFEKAIITEEHITISPSPNKSLTKFNDQNVSSSAVSEQSILPQDEGSKKNDIIQNTKDWFEEIDKDFYLKISAFLIAGILIVFYLSIQKRKHLQRDLIVQAIKQRDYKKAQNALFLWAEKKFKQNSIKNFNQISKLVQDDEFTAQLSLLNKFLYSETIESFDAAKFIEILKKIDKVKRKERKNGEVLPNLYD